MLRRSSLALVSIVAGLIVVHAGAPAFASAWPGPAGITERISQASDGTQADDETYDTGSMSADGRYVVFNSNASNLVAGDTNGTTDLFLLDRSTGTLSIVSRAANGDQGNYYTAGGAVSNDGRYVAFESAATNLVPGDTNGVNDIFVKDRTTSAVTRVNVASGGVQADNVSYGPSLSADGRYVLFTSYAMNLVAGDTFESADVFVADRTTGTVLRVSGGISGVQGNGQSYSGHISADGRYVSFTSDASNIVAGDTNGEDDVFVVDTTTMVTSRVSVSSSGVQGNSYSGGGALSADGRYVAFSSAADNLVTGDSNISYDVFVKDRTTGVVSRISTGRAEAQSSSYGASISADGRYVAFESYAPDLVTGDTNATSDVFVADRTNNTFARVNVSSAEAQSATQSGVGSISGNGQYVTFGSWATDLVSGDTGDLYDVFVRNVSSTDFVTAPVITPPGAPTAVAAVPGVRSASVSWTAPASNGGNAIASYMVVASPGGQGCNAYYGAMSCTVNYLTGGTPHTFTVTARNVMGAGEASAPSAAVVPVSVPGAPMGVTAVAGPAAASVSWVAPLSAGGSTITGFVAAASPGGATCSTTGQLACTITGLTTGTAYTVTVRATNAVGTGAASAASAAVVPTAVVAVPAPVEATPAVVAPAVVAPAVVITVPGQPARVVAMRGHLSAVVTWAAPATGGSPITGYRIVATPGGRACVSTTQLRCTVTGLVNGRTYRFSVTASNVRGAGLASAASLGVAPAMVPGVPSRVVAVRGNARATVSWTVPAANGTTAITGYRVVATPGGASCATTGAARCTVVGLVNGRKYSFTVVAINKVGPSPTSIAVLAVPATSPGVVRTLAATFPASLRTVATWTAPASTGGLPFLRYEYRTSADGGRTWSRFVSVALARSAAVPGLAKGRNYLIDVRAVTGAGAGPAARLAVKPSR